MMFFSLWSLPSAAWHFSWCVQAGAVYLTHQDPGVSRSWEISSTCHRKRNGSLIRSGPKILVWDDHWQSMPVAMPVASAPFSTSTQPSSGSDVIHVDVWDPTLLFSTRSNQEMNCSRSDPLFILIGMTVIVIMSTSLNQCASQATSEGIGAVRLSTIG